MFCDLHTHSVFSDGSETPEAIVSAAKEINLGAIALTDHNTVDGLERFQRAAEDADIPCVCGVEMSCNWRDREVHLLGLFLPEESWETVKEYTKEMKRRKAASNLECIQKLQQAGYAVSSDDLYGDNPDASINRSHIARILVQKGYFTSVSEVMEGILKQGNGFYVPTQRFDVMDMIETIRRVKGIPVWAHPALKYSHEEMEEFIKEGLDHGLMGVETRYSLYSEADRRILDDLSTRYHLLCSGGSDFHGQAKPDTKIGIGTGDLEVPLAYWEEMRKYA